MCVRKAWGGKAARLAGCLLSFGYGGCGAAVVPPGDAGSPSTLNLSALGFDAIPTHVETTSNNLLDVAESADATRAPQVIRGGISGTDDVDVYDLGPIVPGDRVLVSVTTDPSLEAAVALFDDTGASLLINDHRNVYLGRSGPFVDVVIRRESPSCLVAFSATPGYASQGEYVLGASVEFPMPIPNSRSDVVLLDFGRARGVQVGNRPAMDIPPFDAADIDAAYAGRTERLVAELVARVREDFAGYNVTILSTTEGATDDGTMSRVHFGTFDEALLGVAEGVDEYNALDAQEAMVFTDTFAAFSPLDPSVTEMAQALANVASHEIGHLLGLVHTSDAVDLMDVTASLRELLEDQNFARAPIYAAVFPLGDQDSVQSLLDSVGGDPEVARGKPRRLAERDWGDLRYLKRMPARATLRLSRCGHGGRSHSEPLDSSRAEAPMP